MFDELVFIKKHSVNHITLNVLPLLAAIEIGTILNIFFSINYVVSGI